MLTMAESPTGSTAASTVLLQSPAFGSPIKEPSEPSSSKQGSPRSPKQITSLCQKRAIRRPKPYPDRSPGGSICSSDESNGESDDSDHTKQTEQRKIKRLAANTRERKRMHTVNSAFEQLRDLVPTYPSNRKLSKIDTLRLACTYIQDLVSLLNSSHSFQPTDDCIYHPALPDGYIPSGYAGIGIKAEVPEYSFTQYRMPPSECTSSDTFSASESSDNSPPYFAPHSQACSPGIAVRPPPLTRTNSDSAAIYARMAQEQTVNTGQACQAQRQVNIPSPLATCTYTHTAQTQLSMASTPVLSNGLTHQPPPAWSRTGSVPTGYTVYRQ